MRILVLGANGQVGSEMKTAFATARLDNLFDFEVITADRSNLDFRNVTEIIPFLRRSAPDFIINAAAYTAVDKAEVEKDIAVLVNFKGVREIARHCGDNDLPLLQLSTDYVFDGLNAQPYSESDEVGPTSFYGESKLAGERVIRELVSAHIILRTSWVYGSNGNNFVKTMLSLAEEKSELSIVADQVGAPTSARSIASVVATIVLQMANVKPDDERWGTYHFSGLPYVSWADFADEIFNQAMQQGIIARRPKINRITTVDYPTPAARPANSRLDCTKLKKSFGVDPDDWRRSLSEVLFRQTDCG